MFMVMDGTGSATVNLSLKMDDNPNIKGDSCRSVRIGDVELKRTIIGAGGRGNSRGKPKEKEVIRGSGTFVGGERYKVVIRGASAGAGTPRVSRDNIELLDTGGNDTNGTIRIGRIRDRQGAPVRDSIPCHLPSGLEQMLQRPREYLLELGIRIQWEQHLLLMHRFHLFLFPLNLSVKVDVLTILHGLLDSLDLVRDGGLLPIKIKMDQKLGLNL